MGERFYYCYVALMCSILLYIGIRYMSVEEAIALANTLIIELIAVGLVIVFLLFIAIDEIIKFLKRKRK